MSEQQELFLKFDEALRTVKNKANLLYNDTKRFDRYPKVFPTCKPSDVIEKVTNQLKAFHKADSTNRKLANRKNDCKNSEMTTVNIAQVQPPKYTNKFQTQFELDTQMINAIENAEATAENNGLTQEFDNTFCNTAIDESDKIKNSPHISNSKSPIIITKTSKTESIDCVENFKENNNINSVKNTNQIDYKNEFNSEYFKVNRQPCEFLDNGNVNARETLSNFDILNDDEELPSSYIFEPIKKSNTPSPLVFDLNTFESFEKTAQHIVNEYKHVINSQIIGKELFIPSDDANFVSSDEQLSPVLKIDHNRLHIVKKGKGNLDLNRINQPLVCEQSSKNCSFLIDDILFSSDEEAENVKNDLPDMPMTCALETSFYEQDEVLDKTMYVGFQTASDKAIKVCTNSFNKAKSLLVDHEKEDAVTTLSELVNICDRKCREPSENCEVSQTEVVVSQEKKAAILSLENETKHFDPIWLEISTEPLLKNIDKVNDDEEVNDLRNPLTISRPEKRKIHEAMLSSNKIMKISDQTPLAKDLSEQIDDCIINEFVQDKNMFVKKKDTKIEKFIGFKTANHKNIPISEAAFNRMKKIFEDYEVLHEYNYVNCTKKKENKINNSEKSKCKKYETINDPIITIPKVSSEFNPCSTNPSLNCQNKSSTYSKCETNLLKNYTKHDNIDYNFVSKKNELQSFVGFRTASNKHINISEKAYLKTKNMFDNIALNDDLEEDNISCNDVERENISMKRQFKDSSAKYNMSSNKKLELGGFSMSKELMLEKSKTPIDFDFQDSQINGGKIESFMGFQTANKKPIKISAQALANSKKLFKDLDNEVNNTQNTYTALNYTNATKCDPSTSKNGSAVNYKLNPTNSNNSELSKGFQTASNKPIKISMQSLTKSKELFKDIDNEIDSMQINCYPFSNSSAGKCDQSATKEELGGFAVASNKIINMTEKSLAESKLLLNKDKTTEKSVKQSKFKFQGFQTASNKTEKISEEVLTASKKVLENVNNFDRVYTTLRDNNKQAPFIGFKTANKKVIQISEIALQKSRQLFEDINTNEKIKADDKLFCSINKENNNKLEHAPSELEKKLNPNLSTLQNIEENGLTKLIDTQVVSNFEHTLHTEDFCAITPYKSKRSGSPILSCPRAKKRKKFETPYKLKNPSDIELTTNDNFIVIDNESKMLFNKLYKKTKRFNLLNLVEEEKKYSKTNVLDTYITQFSYDTLLEFKFTGKRNDLTETSITVEDIKKLFLQAVNKKLVPEGWLDNHLRLIIWKLISYEIIFSHSLKGACSVRNVLDQLKYRYNKELYNAERPILRKILEKDDVPSKTLILCVVAIFENGQSVSCVADTTSNTELLLSDGWYTVKASIDRMLAKLVYDEKIIIGCKIATNGAELMNCEQGVSPWEDISSVRLKIFGNSTRRARWYARLGCHGNSAIMTPLSSIKPEGGKVSKLRAYVTRVYPALFVEKFEDGSTVTRSERLEHIHQAKYEMERQTALEKLYEEVEKELSDQESQDSESSVANKGLIDGLSQQNVDSRLTHSQIRCLEVRSNKRRERMIQNIEKRMQEKMEKYGLDVKRNVIPLLKLRVAGVEVKNGDVTLAKGLLSIWKPADTIMEMIKEGSWIEVFNIFPTAVRYSEIQISAGRSSVFVESKRKEKDLVESSIRCLNRKCYHVKDLVENPTTPTDYNEIDTVGLIIQIEPQNAEFETSKQPFQNVYLADAEKNMICINFWGGLKKFGYRNILDTGQVVACVNLQRRSGNTKKSIPHYRVTEFSYFTKTPKSAAARGIVEELVKQLSGLDKRKYCDQCVVIKNSFGRKHSFNNENYSPYRFYDHSTTRNKMFNDSPQNQKIIDDNLNLTGLDFESAFKQDTRLSPQMLLRKKRVNEKIDRLKCYGEPPPLSPINIINISKNVSNSFKSPLALKLESNVASNEKSDENSKKESSYIPSSPVMSVNRTYVKSVNPVKLNFSNVHDMSIDDNIDHFAEEFYASPPLSLD